MTQGGREDIPQPMMGGMPPDMMMAEQMPMEEEPMSIEQDAGALAEAVVGRAQGDIGAAVAILDTAKAMLVQSTQQDPMMEQDPMMMAHGGPMYAMGGKYMKPKYAAEGEYLGEESDTLRQMIMDRIQNSPITSMADVTRGQGMILNEGDLMGMGQSGRTLSDEDMERYKQMLMDSMTEADKDLRLEKFFEAYEKDPDAFSKDAEYYNMLEDERKKAAERAKLYRSR